jgi:hypothetical protein
MFENSFEEFDVSAYRRLLSPPRFVLPLVLTLGYIHVCTHFRTVVQELIEEYAASERDDYAQWGQA